MIRFTSAIDLSRLLYVQAPTTNTSRPNRLAGQLMLLQAQSLTNLSRQLETVKLALGKLQSEETTTAVSNARRAAPASAAALVSLQATERPTRLSSTEEVNTVSTSFSPFGPVVSGSTTSLPTLGGIYSGEQGDDTLTFEFRRNAVVGSGDRLDVWVYDGEGDRIDTLRFRDLPADTPVTLSNGMTLSLGAGSVSRKDTFTVEVSATVGSSVDPTKPFDGVRNEQPNFEPGTSVVAGSFEVNGVIIDVLADDTIDSVLAKIDASVAGVTASFDAASESVVLSNESTGPGPTIVVDNDTSNFLDATKLAGATAVPGQDQTLANDLIVDVPALSGVSDGTFSVNGVVLSIDTTAQSLENVVAQINASAASATATLASDGSAFSIRSRSALQDLVLDDGTSGLFSALGVAPGTYRPVRGSAIQRRSGFDRLPTVEKNLRDLSTALSQLLSPASERISELGSARDRLRAAITSSFESVLDLPPAAVLRSGFGLDFDFTKSSGVVEFDRDAFAKASVGSFDALHEFLFRESADGQPQGLLVSLLDQIDSLIGMVGRRLDLLDPKGRFVDLRA